MFNTPADAIALRPCHSNNRGRRSGQIVHLQGQAQECRMPEVGDVTSTRLQIHNRACALAVDLHVPITLGTQNPQQQSELLNLFESSAGNVWCRKLKLDVVSLANNHCLDYGQTGLAWTIKSLESMDIAWWGHT